MNTVYISALPGQAVREAWDDCEGWFTCAHHLDDASLLPQYRLVPVPSDMEDEVKADGQCYECWEGWVDGIRRYHEAEESTRWGRG